MRPSPPEASVRSDHHAGIGVEDATRQRLRGEAAKDHGVRCPDTGAGQHGHHRLGNHRQIDGDPIAGRHAQLEERVGGATDHALEVCVGDGPAVTLGLAHPVKGDPSPEPGRHVTVHAVDAGVEPPPHEPAGVGLLPLQDGRPGNPPVELLGLIGPPGKGVAPCLLVDGGSGVGLGGEVVRRIEASRLVEKGGER